MNKINIFLFFSSNTYVVSTQKNRLTETVLLSTPQKMLKLMVKRIFTNSGLDFLFISSHKNSFTAQIIDMIESQKRTTIFYVYTGVVSVVVYANCYDAYPSNKAHLNLDMMMGILLFHYTYPIYILYHLFSFCIKTVYLTKNILDI